MIRRFQLNRIEDESGISGTGTVAEGVKFTNGTVVVVWYGKYSSTNIYSSVEDMVHIHGHDGKTQVIWTDIKARPARKRTLDKTVGEQMMIKYMSGPMR
jgi:hypothetical protein